MAGPRVMGQIRSRPRVFGKLEDAQRALLPDRAWIDRRVQQTGSFHGTPNFAQQIYGGAAGYACKLSNPNLTETREPDKTVEDYRHTLAIMCDVELQPSDLIDVASHGVRRRYRVTGDAQTRWTGFGQAFLRHCDLALLGETPPYQP